MAAVAETVQVAVRVPVDLVKELEAMAEADDRTLSYVVRQALKAHVEAERKAA